MKKNATQDPSSEPADRVKDIRDETLAAGELTEQIRILAENLGLEDRDVVVVRDMTEAHANQLSMAFIRAGYQNVVVITMPSEAEITRLSRLQMAKFGWFRMPEPVPPEVVRLRGNSLSPIEHLATVETGDTVAIAINSQGRFFLAHPLLAKYGAHVPLGPKQAARVWAYLDRLLPDALKAAEKAELD